jgi:hypothetical protein
MQHTPTPWAKEKTHFAYPPTWMILLNNADYERAKICVNACEPFQDPAKEIQALQDRVKELEAALKDRLRYIDDTY